MSLAFLLKYDTLLGSSKASHSIDPFVIGPAPQIKGTGATWGVYLEVLLEYYRIRFSLKYLALEI